MKNRPVVLNLPPLDGPSAAWLIDLCGQLQAALWRDYGDKVEAHWRATVPTQPIYGSLQDHRPPSKKR